MSDDPDSLFNNGKQVAGIKLSVYLEWASGNGNYKKKLQLPIIQRGFVWKPKQIVELWDSLLRGMPIGSFMVSKLNQKEKAINYITTELVDLDAEAIGLLDGQQRTLTMLLGWPDAVPAVPIDTGNHLTNCLREHCLWIDLGEDGKNGSPFELRITTRAKPFGFQRTSHVRLSLHERREARRKYDEQHRENKDEHDTPDYELYDEKGNKKPRPWKAGEGNDLFIPLKDVWNVWNVFRNEKDSFIENIKRNLKAQDGVDENRLDNLYQAFKRLESLEVPFVMIPQHISNPQELNDQSNEQSNAPAPLTLLFERIGSNGARLSPEDLLFSMIKQEWPCAHKLVQDAYSDQDGNTIKWLMSPGDYVMTAFRLAAAEASIADNPRPGPNDFHRHVGELIKKDKPLRDYLEKKSVSAALVSLFTTLKYKEGGMDTGIPWLMMPHLSRGLIQVLLRWIMLNPGHDNLPRKEEVLESNRRNLIAFALFWYLCVKKEDKASKEAFKIIKEKGEGDFPAAELYKKLSTASEFELMFPLIRPEKLKGIFKIGENGQPIPTGQDVQERELYKRFCWGQKPVLLWLQRAYINKAFNDKMLNVFAGVTDEDAVPYDYDHLCPYNHWGADWRNIIKNSTIIADDFKDNRSRVGNCIGNLHVLDSSLNRSFGDIPLGKKIGSAIEHETLHRKDKWNPEEDSLLSLGQKDQCPWMLASPDKEGNNNLEWNEGRLQAFQRAVYGRAFNLYKLYFEACKNILDANHEMIA